METSPEEATLEQSLGWRRTGEASAECDQEAFWVGAARNGDPQAFNRLVLKWESRIYNLALRMLNDPDEAAETTQEIFLQAFRSLHAFQGHSRFSTWLYRITVNRCVTRLRRRPPLVQRIDAMPGLEQLTTDNSQESELLAGELRAKIRTSLAALSPQQRIVIELKFFQEETFASIAEILGLPMSTIKSRLYTALDLLKVRLRSLEHQL